MGRKETRDHSVQKRWKCGAVAFKMGGLSLEAPVRLSHAESWREGAVIHCRGGPHPWKPYVEHTRAGGSMGTQQETGGLDRLSCVGPRVLG